MLVFSVGIGKDARRSIVVQHRLESDARAIETLSDRARRSVDISAVTALIFAASGAVN